MAKYEITYTVSDNKSELEADTLDSMMELIEALKDSNISKLLNRKYVTLSLSYSRIPE